jgi:S1-C subfamily serine protease
MTGWKTGACVLVAVGVAAAAATLAPRVYGQTRVEVVNPARAVQLFSLGGGRIGVSVTDLDPSDTDAKTATGVRIDSVEEDSPAAKAGLQKGDIVVEFDGERVRSVRQFSRLVSETPVGRQVSAAVTRDGRRVTVNITPRDSSELRGLTDETWRRLDEVREMARIAPRPVPSRPPATPRPARPPIESFFWVTGNQIGVTVNTLSDQLKEYFGVKDGVLVTAVSDDSAAAKAGVKAGDVIVSVNGSSIEDPTDLRARIRDIDAGKEFTLGIMRDRKAMTLKGKLEEPRARRWTSRVIL